MEAQPADPGALVKFADVVLHSSDELVLVRNLEFIEPILRDVRPFQGEVTGANHNSDSQPPAEYRLRPIRPII